MSLQSYSDAALLQKSPPAPTGVIPLGILLEEDEVSEREGFIYVPTKYEATQALPLMVAFHGSGGSGGQMVSVLEKIAEELGIIIIAPDSRSESWELSNHTQRSLDYQFTRRAIEGCMQRYEVDQQAMAMFGFSAGASFALSAGLTEGHRFSHIIAFAPGKMDPLAIVDHPEVLVLHGRNDHRLNIDRTSRVIVPHLRELDLSVDYIEHEGGHTMSAAHLKQALIWFLRSDQARNLKIESIDTRSQGIERT